jgi:hypothetical protein
MAFINLNAGVHKLRKEESGNGKIVLWETRQKQLPTIEREGCEWKRVDCVCVCVCVVYLSLRARKKLSLVAVARLCMRAGI